MSGGWNHQLVRDSFLPMDAELILVLPLISSSDRDSLVWHFDRFGCYSVRSGYWVGLNLGSLLPSSSGSSVFGILNDNLLDQQWIVRARPIVAWDSPAFGFFKVNVDASVSSSKGMSGVGVIIRDHAGLVVASSVAILTGVNSSLLAEAWAILKGLLLARDS
ncbi:hypothetical protein Ddye_004896 [Dipteronia dyeriana]|uniref:RNase H type-1 domain-containing protein n=1 Tax=Dipteronia dyeriana TaxID=168575 RepID=A0AAE0CPQ6_9ROSI|nr:hypothetical protein Ddye_004896 [Dipteronia dyeriana]